MFLTFDTIRCHVVNRFSDTRDPIKAICGEEIGAKLPPIWGLDPEGEMNGVWRQLGVPNLWYMMGNLAWSRFFSKHVALRECLSSLLTFIVHRLTFFYFLVEIKAKQEGIFGTPYPLSVKV